MSNEMNQQPRKRGPMGRMGRGMQPGEKPKDFKKSDQTARSVHRKI
jgi:ATP-binding cassette subfamily B multidrug efflux pump